MIKYSCRSLQKRGDGSQRGGGSVVTNFDSALGEGLGESPGLKLKVLGIARSKDMQICHFLLIFGKGQTDRQLERAGPGYTGGG